MYSSKVLNVRYFLPLFLPNIPRVRYISCRRNKSSLVTDYWEPTTDDNIPNIRYYFVLYRLITSYPKHTVHTVFLLCYIQILSWYNTQQTSCYIATDISNNKVPNIQYFFILYHRITSSPKHTIHTVLFLHYVLVLMSSTYWQSISAGIFFTSYSK